MLASVDRSENLVSAELRALSVSVQYMTECCSFTVEQHYNYNFCRFTIAADFDQSTLQ